MKKIMLISREEIIKHPILRVISEKEDVKCSVNVFNHPIRNVLKVLFWKGNYIVSDPIVAMLCFWRKYSFFSLEMFEYQVEEDKIKNKIRNKIFKIFHFLALSRAESIVFPNDVRLNFYVNKYSLNKGKCKIYPNYPSQIVLNQINELLIRRDNSELSFQNFFSSLGYNIKDSLKGKEIYVYIGTINKGVRGIEKIIESVRQKKDAFLIFAGPQREKHYMLFEKTDHYIYVGSLEHKKALELLCISKYAFLYYSTELMNTNYCAPVKLFEYINAGLILISNKCVGMTEYTNVISYFLDEDGRIKRNQKFKFDARNSMLGLSYEKNFE